MSDDPEYKPSVSPIMPEPGEAIQRRRGRGFRGMSPEKQREISSRGGKAVHAKGNANKWTPEQARLAGRKGGTISRGGKGRLDK